MLPSRRNAGHLAIAVIREIVAPTVFRNAEEEITDIEDLSSIRRVRATPSKFKFSERGRGLLVLRAFNVGGRYPQNRTAIRRGGEHRIGEAFDLNTLVFGDSAMDGSQVLPVKATVQYSDALSTVPYSSAVGESFHNRGDETGTLWDAEQKKNSDNLFNRHFILPGTKLVQILTSNGRQLPLIGLDHLLLSLNLAGSYGGQTSVTGVNVRTHIAGIFAARFESPYSSPYVLLKNLKEEQDEPKAIDRLASDIFEVMSSQYRESVGMDEISLHQKQLVEQFEKNDAVLRTRYEDAAVQVSEMFNRYFL